MPLTEAQKEYQKEYHQNNKEKLKEQRKEYYEKIKEKKKEYNKQYREANKEKKKEYMKEYHKEYNKTEAGKKTYRITRWKHVGVKSDDYNKLYEMYINTTNCEQCNIELIEGLYGNNKRVLDHDHKTGEFRNILCHTCNIRRG